MEKAYKGKFYSYWYAELFIFLCVRPNLIPACTAIIKCYKKLNNIKPMEEFVSQTAEWQGPTTRQGTVGPGGAYD